MVAVNQVEWHFGYHDETLRAFCWQHGITLQAYSPLGGPAAPHPAAELLKSTPVELAARTHNRSSAQIALRWALQQGVPVVTASAKDDRMVADLEPLFNF